MEENTKISFFKRVLISIKDFEKYKIFAVEKVGKSIKYVLQLALILMIIIAISFTVKYGVIINNTLNYIKGDLPDFLYENGNLDFKIQEPLVLESGESSKEISYKIIIDTTEIPQEKIEEYKQKIDLYNYGILVLRDKVIIDSSLATQTIEQSYKDMQNNYGIASSFTKQDLTNYLNEFNIFSLYVQIFIFLYVYLFTSYFLTILLDALLLAILASITARIVRVQIKFSGTYSMALHALTLPIMLNIIYIVVNTFTGFYIKYFDVMYTTVSSIYIIAAILSIRSDLIKEQIEIGKIKSVGVGVPDDPKKQEDNTENNPVGVGIPDDPEKQEDDVGVDVPVDQEKQDNVGDGVSDDSKNQNGDIGNTIPANIEVDNQTDLN